MENIILIGHGSPKADANNIDTVGKLLHRKMHGACCNDCVKVAYLQFVKPEIMETISACVAGGADRIIIHPFFLSAGMHVTKDIPGIIDEAGKRFPGVEFIYTEPLGIHDNLVSVVDERIRDSRDRAAAQQSLRTGGTAAFVQHPIERRSFEIIAEEADLKDIPADRLPIVKRVIHATADFEFQKTLLFHPGAVRRGIEAIRSGRDIFVDVEMARAGINRRLLERWGGKVVCRISEDNVARIAKETGRTRAAVAVEQSLREDVGVIAIGNAHTALLETISILNAGERPAAGDATPLVIGVPVGFVDALESKTLLSRQGFPFITTLSRKGGTPVAVAIVNALLIMAQEDSPDMERRGHAV
jgi:precorrin-8X/cobalt-precorrin-8 methylmutase